MQVQYRLDFSRIHVRAARDDHVLVPVGQEEVPIGVHVAHVPDAEEIAVPDLCGFPRSACVREPAARRHVDESGLAGRLLPSGFVQDLHARAGHRPADAARLPEPLLGGDDGRSPFGHPVELPHDVVAEHLDDPTLHVGWARSSGVDDPSHRCDVVARAHIYRKREQPHEMDRHHHRPRRMLGVDQTEELFRVEPLHQHDGLTHQQRVVTEPQRRTVVQRPAAQVDL